MLPSLETSAVSTVQLSLKVGSASGFIQSALIASLPCIHLPLRSHMYASSPMKLMNWSRFLSATDFVQSWSAFLRSAVRSGDARARKAAQIRSNVAASNLRMDSLRWGLEHIWRLAGNNQAGDAWIHLPLLYFPACTSCLPIISNRLLPAAFERIALRSFCWGGLARLCRSGSHQTIQMLLELRQ